MVDRSLDAGVPSTPFLDPASNDISTPWRLFLLGLHRRTGSAGSPAIGLSTAEALFEARLGAFGDAPDPPPDASLDALFIDTADPAPGPDTAWLLAVSAQDDTAAAPDDPTLAAMMTADIA